MSKYLRVHIIFRLVIAHVVSYEMQVTLTFQVIFSCSKSTIEIVEKGAKYAQS